KGRIYRVYPADKKPREIVRMDKMKQAELVKQLESESGWVRDTAHQMLVRADPLVKAFTAERLATIVGSSKNPQARLHAAFAYDAIEGWRRGTLIALIKDPHPAIRKHGAAMIENFGLGDTKEVLDILEKDLDAQVRQQLAYSLGTASDDHRLVRFLIENI